MISQTIMFKHLYQNPPAAIAFAEGSKISDKDLKEYLINLEKFYEEMFIELSNYGELKELYIVDNLGDHLIGNVYARFNDEVSASKAFNALAGKYYHSNLVEEEYSPINSIRDARCKKFDEGVCQRGALCNFLHMKQINKALIQSLKDEMYEKHPEYKKIGLIIFIKTNKESMNIVQVNHLWKNMIIIRGKKLLEDGMKNTKWKKIGKKKIEKLHRKELILLYLKEN